MSMIGNLARIPEDVRVALHEEPKAIDGLLYPEAESPRPEKPGFFARLFGAKNRTPNSASNSIHVLAESDAIDIDKSWHALHFLFTGTDWEGEFPQGFLVSCGKPVGDVDVGYGPAKSFTPEQVEQISAFLSGLDWEELRSRLDPGAMAELEIYPQVWNEPQNIDEEWDYLEGYFDELTRFVKETANKQMAILVYIN